MSRSVCIQFHNDTQDTLQCKTSCLRGRWESSEFRPSGKLSPGQIVTWKCHSVLFLPGLHNETMWEIQDSHEQVLLRWEVPETGANIFDMVSSPERFTSLIVGDKDGASLDIRWKLTLRTA